MSLLATGRVFSEETKLKMSIVRDERNERIETTVGRILFNEAVREAVLG